METAAYLSTEDRCQSMTVIGREPVPFNRTLGTTIGHRIQELFEEKGVTVINNATITRLEGTEKVEKVLVVVFCSRLSVI